MPLPEFFGICGRNNPRPCKIAWASTDSNPRIGTYPSRLLPTRRTIWHASTQGGYSFTPPVIDPGQSFGSPLLGLFTTTGAFSIQFDTFTPTSRLVFSFARTANRLNAAHILTETEYEAANLENDESDGIIDIDVGEFVYDALAVTDRAEDITDQLTEDEIEALGDLQSEDDAAFRKLFDHNFSNNRLAGVRVNKEGIEYRLDNGGPKAVSALDDSGRGFFVGTGAANTYRDGSSRIIQVNLKDIENYGDSGRPIRPGDVIYLSYIAVKDHYIRESVNVKWAITAQSLPAPQCFGYPTKLMHVAFRFYQWNVEPDDPNGEPVRMAGWRAVEADETPVNYLAMRGTPGAGEIGDHIIGGGGGDLTVTYLPTDVTYSELQAYIQDRSTLPSYGVLVGTDGYHKNVGVRGDQTDTYQNAEWYNRKQYSIYTDTFRSLAKVFFNVHPSTLAKRDVDKFAMEYTMAQEVEIDIAAGKQTFVPFMDAPGPNFPDPTNGAEEYMSSSNTKFDPIQPVSRWGLGNAEIECGVGGGVALGFGSGFNGFGDVLGAFGVNSNIITERFEKNTRVLIEKFATEGEFGPKILAIEGLASPQGAVSCIIDRLGINAFAVHADQDNVLRFTRYDTGDIIDSYRHLEYRPDLTAPQVDDNLSPRPEQFEYLLGYSGMLGDVPGIKPGRAITVSAFLDKTKFKYTTTSTSRLRILQPNIKDDQITSITIEQDIDKITIPVSAGWHGRLFFEYKYSGDTQNLLILFKSGGISGSIDTVTMKDTRSLANTIDIDFKWIKCDTIEIVGDMSDVSVSFVRVTTLDDSVASDFLADTSLSTRNDSDKNLIAENRFYEKSVLFESEVMTVGQDKEGRIFVFFNDRDGGISCVQTNDRGRTWIYHYGIVEPIREIKVENPFVVTSYEKNLGFLFYMLSGKVMCKNIPYHNFADEDSMLVERFDQDRLELGDESTSDTIRLGLYSINGRTLRREQLSYAAAGDLTKADFLELLGKVPDQGEFDATEEFYVETVEGQSPELIQKRKNPVAIGSMTAFGNRDLEDSFWSVSYSDRGELALWYLAMAEEVIGGGKQLQCHFSRDNGISWYDKWEFIENSYNRVRADKDKHTQFIDWEANGDPVSDVLDEDPQYSPQLAQWGVNVHWSRLKRHKVNPDDSASFTDPSTVLTISSPYAFFHEFLRQIFLFYVYEGCLLCKIFHEGTMEFAAERKRKFRTGSLPNDDELPFGMTYVKKLIEQDVRAHFIDGDLSNSNIRDELHYYVNPETNERQIEGNIIYPFIGGLDVFSEERKIGNQRVCAYRFEQCHLRVFYKHEQSPDLRCALWNGSNWYVEELMKSVGLAPPEIPDGNVTNVTGGFGGEGYGPTERNNG